MQSVKWVFLEIILDKDKFEKYVLRIVYIIISAKYDFVFVDK